jgi:uncharacterized cysteine cluster protein YcgN (CxxCxxCC family)
MNNKLHLKIREGTRSDGKRLCDTCRSGTVMRGAAESAEIIYCNQVESTLPIRVVECSRYDDKAAISVHAMAEIAWVLLTDKSGQKIGFLSPDRWRKDRKGEDIIPGEFD